MLILHTALNFQQAKHAFGAQIKTLKTTSFEEKYIKTTTNSNWILSVLEAKSSFYWGCWS